MTVTKTDVLGAAKAGTGVLAVVALVAAGVAHVALFGWLVYLGVTLSGFEAAAAIALATIMLGTWGSE